MRWRALRSDSRGEMEDEARKRADRKTALLGAFEGNQRGQPFSERQEQSSVLLLPLPCDAVSAFEGGEQRKPGGGRAQRAS